MRLRILLVGLIFSLCMTAIGAQAVYLQLFCESWLAQKAADQYERSFTTRGQRGAIYDRNHAEMALSIDVTSIAANPASVSDARSTAKTLSEVLKIDSRDLDRKLGSEKPFVWLKRQVTPKEAKVVRDLKLSGISFQPEFKRFYPNRTLAAQILGFSGIDGQGLEGVEFYYNDFLKSDEGDFKALTDALGRKFDTEKEVMPDYNYSGKNLVLTIDRTVQYIAEKALEETVSEYAAKSGIAIVMNPGTGAILAIAHYPFFNPNSYRDFPKESWRNRAITDQFEPGSTMKIFLAAAALESGICSPNTIFFCENGNYTIGKNTIHDIHPRGWLSLQQIVKYSSNIGAVKVGEKIGSESLYTTLRNFGFGEKTGIDCPGETPGSLANYKRWSPVDAASIAFGQGMSVSALQILTAASAIANNGVLMRPYVVQAVTNQNGRIIQCFGPKKLRRVVSAETAGNVLRILKSAVSEEGTGARAAIEGYTVCGKTGTAQKIDDKGTYSEEKYIASFIGFAPAEKPEISVIVVVDEPEKSYYGGIVATQAFRKIARETLDYTNILPKAKKGRMIARAFAPPEAGEKIRLVQ